MKQALEELAAFLKQEPPKAKQKNYIDLKNGRLNFKVGFPLVADPLLFKPSLLLDDTEEGREYNLGSSSILTTFDYPSMLEPDHQSIDSRICDHIT